MRIKYVGPHQTVTIAATGQTAERGKPLDVDAQTANRLLDQAYWKRATRKKEQSNG